MRTEIYTEVIDRLELYPEHRRELKEKRGFTDEIIDSHRFRSTNGQDLETFLRGKFDARALVESGVFLPGQREIQIHPWFHKDRILIPYLNHDEQCYHLRFSLTAEARKREKDIPKILGLRDQGIDLYQEKNLGKTDDLVITEGEFKAVAGMQLGIPTLSIPGISSFADKHYPRLVELLRKHNIKKVYILFDNEVKDDPQYIDRFKENPQDRYYTQFYACHMAFKLEQSGFDTLVAWLPDSWRENGKIDIDGALAQGKTTNDFLSVLYEAKSREDFIKALPSEARQVVQRKISQKFHRSTIRREYNHYVATRQKGKGSTDEVISNFVINIVATHDTEEGIRREIEFTNEGGRRSGAFTIDPEAMASSDSFRKFGFDKGDYVWRGNIDDLLTIWGDEFLMQDEGRTIKHSDHIGWIEKEGIWLFQNIAITEDGTELRPDKNNTFWLEKRGIKPVPLSMDKGGAMEGVPALHLGTPLDIRDVLRRFQEMIGPREGATLMGWVNSVVFMEEIFDVCNSFPFLFITGQFQSGKSTIAELTMNFFGNENSGKAISQTTPVAIQRLLAYSSCLPSMLDEYRNTKEVISKNGFLRNAYNRQSAGKGTKTSYHAVREAKVRGTLIIAGEETPKDGAVWSRCITVYVSRKNRTGDHYKWFMGHKSKLSGHFLDMIRRKKVLLPEFLRIFEERKEAFLKEDIEDRLAFNYAQVVAGYEVVFGHENFDFSGLIKETQAIQSEFKDERAVSVFLDDLMAIRTRGNLKIEDYAAVEEGKIYLYFHGLHQMWSEQFMRTRGEGAFKEASIRAYLKEEPGYLETNVAKLIGGVVKKCIVFDYADASETIKNFITPNLTDVNRTFTAHGKSQVVPF